MSKEVVFNFLIGFIIGWVIVFFLMLALPAHADEANRTFCQFWTTGTQQQKVNFMMERGSKVHAALLAKFPDKKPQVEATMQCYKDEIKDIVETLDKDCQVERALSDFFKQQVDTTDQEMTDINTYINQCASKAFSQEGAI